MIDLHAHIVPEVDDGARSLSDSLEMARMAAKSGVTILAATSHGEFARKDPGEYLRLYRERLDGDPSGRTDSRLCRRIQAAFPARRQMEPGGISF